MTLKLKLLLLLGSLCFANLVYAQCSTAGDPVSITGSNCPNVVINANKTTVTIQSGGYVGTTAGLSNPALAIQSVNIVNLNNEGTIQGQTQNTAGIQLSGNAVVSTLNNSSIINGALYAIKLEDSAKITRIYNAVGATIVNNGNNATAQSIFLATSTGSPTITTIDNFGAINGSSGAIYLDTANGGNIASIGTINNSGSINGGQDAGILVGTGNRIGVINNNAGGEIRAASCNGLTCYNSIRNWGTIGEINNNGSIVGTSGYGFIGYGIENNGTITTLNNAQSNLTYTGYLPVNYNVIITSPSNYGKMSVVNSAGTVTNFGIANGSTVTAKSYAAVLTGIASSNLTKTSGTYQGLTWALAANGSQYDLNFTGTNTAVTTVNSITAQGLQTAFALQNTVLVNGFTYDCPLFDKNNVCVSAGGRYTAVDAQSVNSGAAVLIGAYRWNNQVRLGAYIDQNVSTNTTGIIKVSNASPMVGLFGVWSERLDGTGAEVKVSAGYGQKNTTMTRPVIDGTEPGSGSSSLTSQGAQAIGKYGFAVADKTILSPYAGLRYTQNNMNGYTENASASVTAPLTYAPLNTNATTVVAGLGATYKVIPAVTLLASAGVEADTNTQYSSYSATGLYGLTPINMNPNPKYTRPTGMLGAYYDVEKNQRISLTGVYRQAPYQGVGATTYMALYTIGL